MDDLGVPPTSNYWRVLLDYDTLLSHSGDHKNERLITTYPLVN